MAHHSAHRNWDLAIGWGHRLLVCDPFQEHVHRELMRAHHAKGDRPAALHQFDLCADFLRRELGVAPMPETVTLYQTMRKGDWSGREIAIPDRRPRPVADTLDRGLRPLGRGVVSDRGK
jgi:DNA-binding SARP family transcriptional activator